MSPSNVSINDRFTNAVLTDVTESLFSAVKRWVYGSGRVSPTLLLAIVRIANGCLGLINKPTLKCPMSTMKEVVHTTDSQPCRYLFRVFATRLTHWAAKFMYERFQKTRDNYDVEKFSTKKQQARVKHKSTKEVHTVDHKFNCVCAGTRCWQRVYSGCLCSHGVSVCIDRLSRCQHNRKEQEKICNIAVKACNKNWLRETYPDSDSDSYKHCVPLPLSTVNVAASIHADVTLSKLKARFVGLASYMSADVVHRFLNELEDRALSSCTNSPISVANPPSSQTNQHGTIVPIVLHENVSDNTVPSGSLASPLPEEGMSDAEDMSPQEAEFVVRPFTCLLPTSNRNSVAAGARSIVEGGHLARGMEDTCGRHPNKYPALAEQTRVLKMSGSVSFVKKIQVTSSEILKQMTEAGPKWQVMVEALAAECMHGCSKLHRVCVSLQEHKRKSICVCL